MNNPGDIFKRIMNSRLAWDVFQGRIYNRLIWNAAGTIIEDVIDRTKPPRPDARVLDVGSGPGFAAIRAARKYPAATIIGVDYSLVQVLAARRNLKKNPAPNCSFRLGNAMDLPFEDNTFDMVISIASIKHWQDSVRGLREISRVLKPGCEAHIGEADRECSPRDLDRFISDFTAPWWVNKRIVGWYLRSTVFGRSYNCAEAERMAAQAGFATVKVEKIHGAPAFRMTLTNA
ncbi:MAG: class I SAM-dependent methyltransferase [bacterium]